MSNQMQINDVNKTNNSDIHNLVERDRSMMVELEKMKEERKRIIESLTKDDQMVNRNNNSHLNSVQSKLSENSSKNNNKNQQSNFNMIRSEYKTDHKDGNNNINTTERNKSINSKKQSLNSNSKSDLNQNQDHLNQEKDLKKHLSFGNIIKSKKPSVAEELVLKQQSELTFKPKTNNMPDFYQSKKEYNPNNLFKDMRSVYKRREEERIRLENEEIEQNYTFHPKIPTTDQSIRQNNISNAMPRNVNERLSNPHN